MTIDLLLLSMQLKDQSERRHLTDQLDQWTRGGKLVQRSLWEWVLWVWLVRCSEQGREERGEWRQQKTDTVWVQLKKRGSTGGERMKWACVSSADGRIPINSSVQVCCNGWVQSERKYATPILCDNRDTSCVSMWVTFKVILTTTIRWVMSLLAVSLCLLLLAFKCPDEQYGRFTCTLSSAWDEFISLDYHSHSLSLSSCFSSVYVCHCTHGLEGGIHLYWVSEYMCLLVCLMMSVW